ncbi:MAG: hypothetical protein M1833_006366 [Piccolia ochrophora]|nr:MAG: hypothetical protein M1833_006366 [Piccolia ochrophora]
MAFIHDVELPWHDGEDKMHEMLHIPEMENPTSTFLTPGAAIMLSHAPLLALGTLDSEGRPWTTVWGGERGFSRPIGKSIIGIKMLIDKKHDPVVQSLVADVEGNGEVFGANGEAKMVGGLTIDLETRQRIKLYGRMVAGSIDSHPEDDDLDIGQVHLAVRIEQSMGNCPKYLNIKHIRAALPDPSLISEELPMPQRALDLINKCDIVFLSSSHHSSDMDTNCRGGPSGFVRVLSNDSSNGTVLVYPEYSGNRLYQTLGNLQTTPLLGIVFPDFATGDVLYVTGTTEILFGQDALQVLPHSKLAVKVTLTAARLVEKGLAFRGSAGEPSPYLPKVRYLRTEHAVADGSGPSTTTTAHLTHKKTLTPTISRMRFRMSGPEALPTWKAGQYAAFSFEDELDSGYSHMRDDDPRSLNDDYTRTFTVSSAPGTKGLAPDEFEITFRNVGVVTAFLFRQLVRSRLEIPLLGFGGEFFISQRQDAHDVVPLVAGGIGITPLLAQLPALDPLRLRLFWTLHADDVNLVVDAFTHHPALAPRTTVFLTATGGSKQASALREALAKISEVGARLERRRLGKEDLLKEGDLGRKWYVCTGPALRKAIVEWLEEREVVYEDFNY